MNNFWDGFEKEAGSLGRAKLLRAYKSLLKSLKSGRISDQKFDKLHTQFDNKAYKTDLKELFRRDVHPEKKWPHPSPGKWS